MNVSADLYGARAVEFADRASAGAQLADVLATRRFPAPVVLGLPRGGIPVAYPIATRLRAPLDVLVVRKLGCPGHRELEVGALGEGGVEVLDHRLLRELRVSASGLAAVRRVEREELDRRVRSYRGERPPVPLEGRTALIVDDGLATGSTARAGVAVARARGAECVVVAVPVAPAASVQALSRVADEVVVLSQPHRFRSVGEHYGDFSQATDAEVADLLARAELRSRAAPPASGFT